MAAMDIKWTLKRLAPMRRRSLRTHAFKQIVTGKGTEKGPADARSGPFVLMLSSLVAGALEGELRSNP